MLLFQTTLRNCWEVCYYFVITVIGLTQTVFFLSCVSPLPSARCIYEISRWLMCIYETSDNRKTLWSAYGILSQEKRLYTYFSIFKRLVPKDISWIPLQFVTLHKKGEKTLSIFLENLTFMKQKFFFIVAIVHMPQWQWIS